MGNYKRWTTEDEAIIIESKRNGQYKGVVNELCNKLGVTSHQLRNHVMQMKKQGRL